MLVLVAKNVLAEDDNQITISKKDIQFLTVDPDAMMVAIIKDAPLPNGAFSMEAIAGGTYPTQCRMLVAMSAHIHQNAFGTINKEERKI